MRKSSACTYLRCPLPEAQRDSVGNEWPPEKGSLIFFFIFLIWSWAEIIFFVFRKFWIRNVPIGKKSTLVPKIGGFCRQKRSSDFYYFFLIWSLDQINLLKFGTFGIWNVPIGKKSNFVPKIGDFGDRKRFSDFFFIF